MKLGGRSQRPVQIRAIAQFYPDLVGFCLARVMRLPRLRLRRKCPPPNFVLASVARRVSLRRCLPHDCLAS